MVLKARLTHFWSALRAADDHLTLAVFAFTLSVLTTTAYLFARWGFPTPIAPVAHALTLAAFLLFLPPVLRALWQAAHHNVPPDPIHWPTSSPAFTLGVLIALLLLGFFAFRTGLPLMPLVYLLALPAAILAWVAWLSTARLGQSALFLLLPAAFMLWLIQPIYADSHHHPLFLEGLLVPGLSPVMDISNHLFVPDTPFHATLGQMLARFGVASSALDGIVRMPYYVGSHWVLFHTGQLVGVTAIESYVILYPIVFVPFMFAAFGGAALAVRTALPSAARRTPPPLRSAPGFWLIFVIAHVGLIEFQPLHIVGESALFSLTALSLTIALTAQAAATYAADPRPAHPPIHLFAFLLLYPLLLGAVGYSKSPAAFVLVGFSVVVFLRLGLFRRYYYVIWLILVLLVGAWVFRTTVWGNALNTGASFAPFNLLRCCVAPPLRPVYYPVELAYLLLSVWLVLPQTRPSSWSQALADWRAHRYLPAELLLVLGAGAIAPGLVLSLGRDSLYFSSVARWLGAIVLLAHIHQLALFSLQAQRGQPLRLLSVTLRFTLVVLLLFVVAFHTRRHVTAFVDLTLTIRAHYIPVPAADTADHLTALRQTYATPPAAPYAHPAFAVFSALANLEDAAAPDTALYIPKATSAYWDIPFECSGIPFIAPALSGLPLIYGFPPTNCQPFYGELTRFYAYSEYPDIVREPPGATAYPDDMLCQRATDRGFTQVIILTTDDDQAPVTRVLPCSN